MVASFSEEGDQLSQWRGYADNSRGVSIGLDLSNLRPPVSIGTAVTFAPCLYKQADKNAVLKAAFAHYRNGLQGWWNGIMDIARKRAKISFVDPQFSKQLIAKHTKELEEVTRGCYTNLQFDLLRIAPLLKDQGFSEEKEWRLTLPQRAITMPIKYPLEFRPTGDTLVPYIAYPLNSPNQEGPIFLKELILGPGSHPSAGISVDLFLRKHEIPSLARPSKIPYRPT